MLENTESVDLALVKAQVPTGIVSAEVVLGGLDVEMMGQITLIANAIVTVSFDVEKST